MRSTRLLTGAALSAAALGLSTAAAYAGDFGSIEVSPGMTKAGSTVSLSTKDCGSSNSANVDAGTLGTGSVKLAPGASKGTLTGQMQIKSGVKNGNYGVSGKCSDGKEITGTVHVGMQGAGSSPSSQGGMTHSAAPSMPAKEKTGPSMPAKEKPSPSMSAKATPGSTMPPKGKMKTGEGSTSEDGSNTTEIAAGAGVLLAAAAGGIWAVRRRRPGGRY
ncbi:hypothetical protein GCM10010211_67040 [Streptomyces albospinus]|uniref:LPXTG cell wall anchor domain-containing protein n=1 Tax=Streptomyces albospinus TaxID=285515 RepID=A0ABQ2VKB2_9ACTN|nr:hypothetical protein [Streptomyces albospinus]GGU90995.1 hypothetical protein GCM10010211_67040 [Streptomyces albospinus]